VKDLSGCPLSSELLYGMRATYGIYSTAFSADSPSARCCSGAGTVPLGQSILALFNLTGMKTQIRYGLSTANNELSPDFGALSSDYKNVDDRFEVYFDLATGRFINPRRGVVPPRSIPVRDALETRSLLNWLRQHGNGIS
jgi:hypothetical protein